MKIAWRFAAIAELLKPCTRLMFHTHRGCQILGLCCRLAG
jgi:hypothetical protein